MTALVHYQREAGVATINLRNGKVNAISHEVIDAFHAALDQAEAKGEIVIITGQTGMFCGGYDLKTMQKSLPEALALVKAGSTLSRRLLSFPTPIISACEGHAIAKGAFILLSSDYRIGAAGDFKIGLNEVAIGITMHYAGLVMARNRLATTFFGRAVNTAEIFDPETALKAGFLDEITEPQNVLAEAHSIARQYKTLDMKAHHRTKLKAREALLVALDDAIEKDDNGTL
ncbi:MAG: enoyl-CoA hydratase [Gammaproteobacteria bacterium]|nr:MAG: enoyl-CoA hydratase [Gammaproteobacteria bacterium]